MARVAIVTGGTRGIGEAISIALHNKGMKVAANYAGNEERARTFTERTGIAAYQWDVSDFEACQEGARKIEAELGPVDVLVNNAGIAESAPFGKTTVESWERHLRVNVTGPYLMTRALLGFCGLICLWIIKMLPILRRKGAAAFRAEGVKNAFLVEHLQGIRTVKSLAEPGAASDPADM